MFQDRQARMRGRPQEFRHTTLGVGGGMMMPDGSDSRSGNYREKLAQPKLGGGSSREGLAGGGGGAKCTKRPCGPMSGMTCARLPLSAESFGSISPEK